MSSSLNFDYLSKLYQSDPDKFEALRLKEIETLINSASEKEQQRLKGLQFQIDAKRKIHKNSSVGTCLAISKMMHESFESLRFYLNQAANIKDPLGPQFMQKEDREFSEGRGGNVIQFRK